MRGSGVRIPSAAPVNYLIYWGFLSQAVTNIAIGFCAVATWSPRWHLIVLWSRLVAECEVRHALRFLHEARSASASEIAFSLAAFTGRSQAPVLSLSNTFPATQCPCGLHDFARHRIVFLYLGPSAMPYR
jgi:hypothetical protein